LAAFALLAALEFRSVRVLDTLRQRSTSFEQRLAGSETEIAQTREKLEGQAAEAARTLAEREQIFHMAMDMICVAGTDGYFRRVNPAFTRTLGYSEHELVSRPFIEFIHPDDREATVAELSNLASGRDCIDFENRYCAKDGSYRWLAWRCPAVIEGTDVVYAIARDVTDRKRVEMELRRAMAATEAASRARSEFVANMSHEIRTPLNGILGMVELALETNVSPHLRDYLETINQSAELLLMIVNDVLDFSKMESGKFQLDSTSFGLRETLGQTLQALAPRAHLKGLELAFHISPEAPDALIGDPVRLRQTVTNLVGNAIKFTERGEVLLRVEPAPDEILEDGAASDDAVQLHFLVRDTGIGVPADKQDKIFEAFSQADASTTRKYGGTGLGLTISSYLVQQMGGRIWLESREGDGSKFHFTAAFQRQASDPYRPSPPRKFPGVKVLAVDDNSTNLRILEEMLRGLEAQPTLVSSGRVAWEEFQAARRAGEPFQLAIVDFHMPEMDGFTLAQKLLASEDSPAVIVLTSSDRPSDCERFMRIGVAAHLSKPIRQKRLVEAISQALEGKPAEPVVAAAPVPTTLSPLKVLVAEDSAVNQRLVLELLGRRGHVATLAINGNEAVRLSESHDFDVILMDVQMPELDGLEATRRIRASEQETGRRTPIIAMTAHAMRGDRERCLAAGMDDYLSKPLRAGQLFAKLAEVAGTRHATENETAAAPPPAEPADGAIRWREAVADLGGDEELLCDLGQTLLADAPRLMDHVRRAVASRDPEGLSLAAHALKGSVRPFAALRAFEAAFRLEKMGRANELEHAPAALAELEQEMAGVISSVNAHVLSFATCAFRAASS
jgi:PAS domain S-box-containing protein